MTHVLSHAEVNSEALFETLCRLVFWHCCSVHELKCWCRWNTLTTHCCGLRKHSSGLLDENCFKRLTRRYHTFRCILYTSHTINAGIGLTLMSLLKYFTSQPQSRYRPRLRKGNTAYSSWERL